MEILSIIIDKNVPRNAPHNVLKAKDVEPIWAHAVSISKASRYITRSIFCTSNKRMADIISGHEVEALVLDGGKNDKEALTRTALHVLKYLSNKESYSPELIVLLVFKTQPITIDQVDGTIQALIRLSADTALTIVPFDSFIWELKDNEAEINLDKFDGDGNQKKHRYSEAGTVYVVRTEQLKNVKNLIFGKTAGYITLNEEFECLEHPVNSDLREIVLTEKDFSNVIPDNCKGIAFDFDGVFTDNAVIVTEDGIEAVKCNRGDGLGIDMLKEIGIPIVVISKERNPVVAARCRKLGIECIQGVDDKRPALELWAAQRHADLEAMIFVGNDINDLECLLAVGCPIVVSDAHPMVKPYAKIILTKPGGMGAVRELSELVLKKFRQNGK